MTERYSIFFWQARTHQYTYDDFEEPHWLATEGIPKGEQYEDVGRRDEYTGP